MKYNFYKLNKKGVFDLSINLLSKDIVEYLEKCELDLYDAWKKKYDMDTLYTGVGYFLNPSVLANIKKINKSITDKESKYFIEDALFQHYNAYYDKLVNVLLDDDIADKRILFITQEESFRKKFNYDSTAITMDLIINRTQKFFKKLEIKHVPEIYCIAFSDTPKIRVKLDFVSRNNKKELILEWNE